MDVRGKTLGVPPMDLRTDRRCEVEPAGLSPAPPQVERVVELVGDQQVPSFGMEGEVARSCTRPCRKACLFRNRSQHRVERVDGESVCSEVGHDEEPIVWGEDRRVGMRAPLAIGVRASTVKEDIVTSGTEGTIATDGHHPDVA